MSRERKEDAAAVAAAAAAAADDDGDGDDDGGDETEKKNTTDLTMTRKNNRSPGTGPVDWTHSVFFLGLFSAFLGHREENNKPGKREKQKKTR